MADRNKNFDADGFYSAIEATMVSRDMNWKAVSQETGISQSTLTRMAQGRKPDAASLASLGAWAGLNPADFVKMKRRAQKAEPLAIISTHLRSDPNLTAEGAAALEEMLKAAYKGFAAKRKKN
jgi:DNA-binding Xre family transcriptional regulator